MFEAKAECLDGDAQAGGDFLGRLPLHGAFDDPALSADNRDHLGFERVLQERAGGLEDPGQAIKKARADLPDAIAAAEKKAAAEKIQALEDEKALAEANGAKRLADLEGLNLKEEQQAKRRKQIEDEIAAQRLELENQIGELQEESSTRREAREAQFAADAIQRVNALAAALKSSDLTGTKPGDLITGTNRRRGSITSDTFEQGSGVQAGNYARPLTDFSAALKPQGSGGFGTQGGFVPPSSIPPASSTLSGSPSAGGQPAQGNASDLATPLNGIAAGVEAAAKSAKEAEEKVEAAGLSKAIAALGATVGGRFQALQRQIDDIRRNL